MPRIAAKVEGGSYPPRVQRKSGGILTPLLLWKLGQPVSQLQDRMCNIAAVFCFGLRLQRRGAGSCAKAAHCCTEACAAQLETCMPAVQQRALSALSLCNDLERYACSMSNDA